MDASSSLVRTATSGLIAAATAIVILGASILPFLTPAWAGFEQGRAESSSAGVYRGCRAYVTNALLADLVFGNGDFDVSVAGLQQCEPVPGSAAVKTPLLTVAERQHLIDVRGVFRGFALLVALSISILVVLGRRTRGADGRRRTWAAVRLGASGLAVTVLGLGVIALVAFDAAFEVFHGLFFAPGTFDFDPATSKLIQLFPEQLWSESTITLAVVIVVAAGSVAWFAGRRLGASGRGMVTAPADGDIREPRQSRVGEGSR